MIAALTSARPVDVRLSGSEVSPFDGVVEEPIDAVAVVLIVLGGVNSTLGGNRVRPARAVLVTETLDIESLLAKRRRS